MKAAPGSTPFSLVKWYMDCVTYGGDAAIVYAAEVRWRGLHASYGSVLLASGEGVSSRSSLGTFRVDASAERVQVELPRLKVSGSWAAGPAAIRETIFENSDGRVDWNCLQPRSSARITAGDMELSGQGYLECLELTLPPWQLPMRELRWGRFVGVRDSLVWIDWRGPYSASFAYLNGSRVALRSISDAEAMVDGATLLMTASVPIRIGRLEETVLRGVPVLRTLFPHSIFNVEEHKWKSRGVLEMGDCRREGWVIHEVVRWNQ